MTKKEKKPQNKKIGRPSSFTKKIGNEICERISGGDSLRSICADKNMPSKTAVLRWLRNYEEFRAQYAYAREAQAESFIDEMIDIADDGSNDLMTIKKGDKTYEVENKEVTNRSKLRIEVRQFIAMKLLPKKYGLRPEEPIDPKNNAIVDVPARLTREEWIKHQEQ